MTVKRRRRIMRISREAGEQPLPSVAATEVTEEVAEPFIFPDADGTPIKFADVAHAAPSHTDLIAGLEGLISHRRELQKLRASPAATLPLRYLIGAYRVGDFHGGAIILLAEEIGDYDDAVAAPDIAPRAAALARDFKSVADAARRVVRSALISPPTTVAEAGTALAAKTIVDASFALAALPAALDALAAAVAPQKRAALEELAKWTQLHRRIQAALDHAFSEVTRKPLDFNSGDSQGAIFGAWVAEQCTGQPVSPYTFASRVRPKASRVRRKSRQIRRKS